MDTHAVIRVAQQLAAEGKTPSIALIKNRLPHKLAMPTLIAGLKQWQADPQQTLPEAADAAAQPSASPQDEALTTTLQTLLAPLQDEIRQLRDEVAALKAEIKRQ